MTDRQHRKWIQQLRERSKAKERMITRMLQSYLLAESSMGGGSRTYIQELSANGRRCKRVVCQGQRSRFHRCPLLKVVVTQGRTGNVVDSQDILRMAEKQVKHGQVLQNTSQWGRKSEKEHKLLLLFLITFSHFTLSSVQYDCARSAFFLNASAWLFKSSSRERNPK